MQGFDAAWYYFWLILHHLVDDGLDDARFLF